MSIIQAIILGIIQGLTEFIPVSSSGHLVIAHRLMGVDGGLAFDIVLHVGTLVALIIFFYSDIWQLIKSVFVKSPQTRLAWLLAMATVPAVISGFLLQDMAENNFRSPHLVAVTLLVFALVMLAAEYMYKRRSEHTKLEKVSVVQAAVIGLTQAIAVIPGVSRSGSTITAGMFSGLSRTAATRFSFLLAIPITAGACLKVLASHDSVHLLSQHQGAYFCGFVSAAISGIFAIKFLLRFLSNHGLYVFAYYRIALAVAVLLFV